MVNFKPKTLWQLTWPLFIVSALNVGATLADTALVSSYSDNLAAAVSMANLILDIPYEISAALAFGTAALVARRLGSDDEAGARKLAVLALVANTMLNVVLAAVLWLFEDGLIAWVNTPPEIQAETRIYLQVVGAAMIFNGYLTVGTALLRAHGHTVEILVLGIISNVAYLGLEYVLIFGNFGFPEMGVAGTAWASFIVRGLGIALITWLLWIRIGLRFRWGSVKFRSLSQLSQLLEMARLSFPALGESILFKLYTTMMVGKLALLGTSAVLIRSYTLTVTAFLSLLPYVVSQGNDVLVGYDVGAGDAARARKRTLRNGAISGLVVTCLAGAFAFASDWIIGMFTDNPDILAGAKILLWITVLMQPFQAMNTLCYNALRVVGDAYAPVVISLSTTWLLAFPVGWVLVVQSGMGPTGLWLAVLLDEVVKCGLLTWRWVRMEWSERLESCQKSAVQMTLSEGKI